MTHLQYKVDKLEAVLATFVTTIDSTSKNKRVETFESQPTGAECKTTMCNITIGYRQSEQP